MSEMSTGKIGEIRPLDPIKSHRWSVAFTTAENRRLRVLVIPGSEDAARQQLAREPNVASVGGVKYLGPAR